MMSRQEQSQSPSDSVMKPSDTQFRQVTPNKVRCVSKRGKSAFYSKKEKNRC